MGHDLTALAVAQAKIGGMVGSSRVLAHTSLNLIGISLSSVQVKC